MRVMTPGCYGWRDNEHRSQLARLVPSLLQERGKCTPRQTGLFSPAANVRCGDFERDGSERNYTSIVQWDERGSGALWQGVGICFRPTSPSPMLSSSAIADAADKAASFVMADVR